MINITILNGSELRKFRKAYNLTQAQLAEIMGLTSKYIYLHENNIRYIKKIKSWQLLNKYIMEEKNGNVK